MEYLLSMIRDYLFAPVIIGIAGAAVAVLTKYCSKMTRSSSVKEELSSLDVSNSIRASVIQELDAIVKAAVATNMSFVESIKIEQRKLTDEEAAELNSNARTLIMNSLPAEIRQEDGKIMNIIGGPEALDALIKILIEKHVYEYKPISKQNIAEATNICTSENMNDDLDTVETTDDPSYSGGFVLQGEPQEVPDVSASSFNPAEVEVPEETPAVEESEKRVPNPTEVPSVYTRGGVG